MASFNHVLNILSKSCRQIQEDIFDYRGVELIILCCGIKYTATLKVKIFQNSAVSPCELPRLSENSDRGFLGQTSSDIPTFLTNYQQPRCFLFPQNNFQLTWPWVQKLCKFIMLSQSSCIEADNINRAEVTVRPSVAEILANPTYPETIWNLTPTQSGKLLVAKDRGGPLGIDWEVHGNGPIKLVVSFFGSKAVLFARFLVSMSTHNT